MNEQARGMLVSLGAVLLGSTCLGAVAEVMDHLAAEPAAAVTEDAGPWFEDVDVDTAAYNECISTGVYECPVRDAGD